MATISDVPVGDAGSAAELVEAGTQVLRAADLDAMAPATWLALVRWYLEAQGYRIVANATDDEAGVAWFTCRPAPGEFAEVWVVTPLASNWAHDDDARLARSLARKRGRRRDVALVVATRLGEAHARRYYGTLGGVSLVARNDLLAFARLQEGAFAGAQAQAEAKTDARAAAALAVQASLRTALRTAADTLTTVSHAALTPDASSLATVVSIEQGMRPVRQALLACETLAEEWSHLFAATPTRADALAIERGAGSIAELGERAAHLGAALRQAVDAWLVGGGQAPRALQRWRTALSEEATLHCRLIASKLTAVDPAAWREFAVARPAGAAAAIAEAQAAWQRAVLRARRLRDECDAVAPKASPHPVAQSGALDAS
jgi:hypothetical protein